MAYDIAIFTSPKNLQETTALNNDIDTTLLRAMIVDAQTVIAPQWLGCDLYEQLQAQKIAGTLTAANTILIEQYLRPALNQYVLATNLIHIHYRYRNKGVVVQSGENSQPSDLAEVKALQNNHRDLAESLANRMIEFLNDNSADYPAFLTSSNCKCSNNRSSFTCSIHF